MALPCPYCDTAVPLPDTGDQVLCPSCGRRFDIAIQQAYARGEDAFLSAADLVLRAAYRGDGRSVFRAKALPDSLPLPPDVIHAYQRAYSALRVALRGTLSDEQYLSANRMLAEITRLFAPRSIVSPLEAEYWARRAVEAIVQQELDRIRERLAVPPASPVFGHLQRLHLRLRGRRLSQTLAKLTRQLQELEDAIGFLDPPRPFSG